MNTKHLPRGITVRPDRGTYVVRVTHEGKRVTVGTYQTLGQAENALRQALKEIALGIFGYQQEQARNEKTTITVADFAEQWFTECQQRKLAPTTLTDYRTKLDLYILPEFGDKKLSDVTRKDIDSFANRLLKQGRSFHKTIVVTRALFQAAVRHELIETTPVKINLSGYKKRSHSGEEILTPAQVRQIAELMPERYRLSVLLAAWCALRLGEVLGLQRGDFVFTGEECSLHIERQWQVRGSKYDGGDANYRPLKTASSRRTISVPQGLIPEIHAHLDSYVASSKDAPLFTSGLGVLRPVSQSNFDRVWRQARDQVCPGFRFHNLRHTGLTLYAQQGATLEELRVRAGHSDYESVARYQHATVERDRALTAKLDGLIQ